ncbi:S41 family peptidase [Vagococcus sp.]|uniref:S41 family peptidase n=1 Tax=Vagococcus sp. TaxID=1933889 RepID=UPI003F9C4BB0
MTEQIRDILTVYQQALNLFPYWTDPKIEAWSTACFSLLEEVKQEISLSSFYFKLMKVTATLNDGHTLVYLPSSLKQPLYLPFRLGIVTGKLVIKETSIENKKFKNRPIQLINQQTASDFLKKLSRLYWKNSEVVSLEYFQNSPFFILGSEDFELVFEDGETVKLGYQKTVFEAQEKIKAEVVWCETEAIQIYAIGKKVVVRLKHFMSPEIVTEFYRYAPEYLDYEEIIFDVRDNLGGNSGFANELTQAFYDTEFLTEKTYHQVFDAECYASGTMMFYQKEQLSNHADADERQAYQMLHHQHLVETLETDYYEERRGLLKDLPVTILQNRGTYSSAENFIINFDNEKRARLVGEMTAGSTGQPALIKLATGGVFMVTAKKTCYPNGKSHHNLGIEPDIWLEETLASRKEGRDKVLEFCLAN